MAYESLHVFGITDEFIDLIKILYTNPTSTVINNGFWSEWINPNRGTRQGDPISSLIFTATAEVLGIKLHANIKIAGIDTGGDVLLNVQYADDTWLALEANEENINNALNELKKYEEYSGLTINFDKSTAFILGPLRDTDAKFYTMKQLFWSNGPIKILGLYYHPDWKIMHYENYDRTLLKMRELLDNWLYRSLTIPGKIVIINFLISSLLIYKFMSLPSPSKEFFSEYKRMIIDFLWSKKTPKICYNKLVQSYKSGGLKLVDLALKDRALKASWVLRWFTNKTLDSNSWIYTNLPIKDERIWLCNISQYDIDHLLPMTHDISVQVLKAWNMITYDTMITPEGFESSPIWLNSEIR